MPTNDLVFIRMGLKDDTIWDEVYDKATLEPRLKISDAEIAELERELRNTPEFDIARRSQLSQKIAECQKRAMPGRNYCKLKELEYSQPFYKKVQKTVIEFIEKHNPNAYPKLNDSESQDESLGFTLNYDGTLSPSTPSLKERIQMLPNIIFSSFREYLHPLYKNFLYPNIFSGEKIAEELWLDENAIISEDMVQKVNNIATYLAREGLHLKGAKADGDCFFHAFLLSYQCLTKKIPILEKQKDQIFFLRSLVASQFEKLTPSQSSPEEIERQKNRAEAIRKGKEWLTASGEGDLLAVALEIPIRVITVSTDVGWFDFLTWTEENQRPQIWDSIDEKKRPKEYICIVDLGGHFIPACPLTVEVSHQNSQVIPVKGDIFGNAMRGVNALPSFTNAGDRWIEQRPSFFS